MLVSTSYRYSKFLRAIVASLKWKGRENEKGNEKENGEVYCTV